MGREWGGGDGGDRAARVDQEGPPRRLILQLQKLTSSFHNCPFSSHPEIQRALLLRVPSLTSGSPRADWD